MSTPVEKKHLLGQAARHRKRGQAPTPRAPRHIDVRDAREAEAPSDASHCDEEGARREPSGVATVLASSGRFLGLWQGLW